MLDATKMRWPSAGHRCGFGQNQAKQWWEARKEGHSTTFRSGGPARTISGESECSPWFCMIVRNGLSGKEASSMTWEVPLVTLAQQSN